MRWSKSSIGYKKIGIPRVGYRQTIAKVQPEHVCGLPTGSNDLSVGSTMGHSTGNTLNVSACILQKKIEI